MTLIQIDGRFGHELPNDGPVYPLLYLCELEAGLFCTKDGALAFVEPKRGFGVVQLFMRLVQDDEDSDIEIRNLFWGSEQDAQELEGGIANAAEDFVKLDWGGIENAFRDHAATDWKRIVGRGYRAFLAISQRKAA
jgi:hypothetical protein